MNCGAAMFGRRRIVATLAVPFRLPAGKRHGAHLAHKRDSSRAACRMVARTARALLIPLFFLAGTAFSADMRVRVGIYENSPKVSPGKAGRPEGIFVDIIESVAEEEGWTLEYVPGTWMEGLDRLAAGEIDLMPDVAQSKSRGARYAFHSEPVLSDWFQVYARKGSGIRSVIDLAGKRVAVLAGSVQEEAFGQMYSGFNVKLTMMPFPDYRNAFLDVSRGATDAVVVNRFYGIQSNHTYGLEDTAIIFHPTRLFFAAPPHGREGLLAAIDRQMIRLKKDPASVYYRSLKRWTSEAVPFRFPNWLKFAAAAGAGLLLSSLAWTLTLRRQVARRSAELAASNRLLRQVIEDAPEAIIIQTRGRIAFLNPVACSLFGASSGQLLGRSVADLAHPGCRETVKRHIVETNEQQRHIPLDEEVFLRLDGTPVTVEVIAVPFVYENENGSLIFARDVTGRKLQEHLYESLAEDMPALFCRYTPDGVLTFVNSAVCAFQGTTKSELVGHNFLHLLPDSERIRVESAIRRMAPERPAAGLTEAMRRTDGVMRQVRWVNRAIFASNGQILEVQSIGIDITDQQRLKERLAQAHKMETIGLLADGIAHDFNNELQAILGFAELALMQTPPPDPRAADVQEIIAAAEHAKRFTGQLLAFSRKAPMKISGIQINKEIEDRRQMLSRLLGEKISIQIVPDKNLPDILADAGQIEQMLLNLAVNARDAMPDGGTLTINTSCRELTEADSQYHLDLKPGDYACLAISDTGCGIPPEIQDRIFDPFFTTKSKEKGTGLGLSTVYRLVQQLKGWIEVSSQVGGGTTFSLFFPAAGDRAQEGSAENGSVAHRVPKDNEA